MNFLGIYREPEYSPGRHTSNDSRILELVGQALERLDFTVQLASLDQAEPIWKQADIIFSMCQGPQALAELRDWKKQGGRITNDPVASRNTYRDTLIAALRGRGLAFPQSAFLPTDGSVNLESYDLFFEKTGAWLKRTDVHAMGPGDVLWVEGWENLEPALRSFRSRGLRQAVLQKHCPGDEVKFYAVRGGKFFWPYYPRDCQGYPFEEEALRNLAEAAAETLEIDIYGGDAIIAPDGNITLIDLNDWPSFAPCRGAAASAIAHHLKDHYHANENRHRRKATAQVR
jgi:hypothetical protein